MNNFLKKSVNGLLAPLGFKVIRLPRENVSGQYLFEDIKKILATESPSCLDIGANKGQTIDRLLEVFRAPTIHAFEPLVEAFSVLQGNGYPAHVQLHNLAMGSEVGRRQFFNYGESQLSSFLRLEDDRQNPFRKAAVNGAADVDIDTVDAFLSASNIAHVDLLKIDTQGFDFEVLKGASRAIASGKVSCVLVEINFIRLYEGQADAAEIIDFLAKHHLYLVDLYEKVTQGSRLAWCTALFLRDVASEPVGPQPM